MGGRFSPNSKLPVEAGSSIDKFQIFSLLFPTTTLLFGSENRGKNGSKINEST